MKRRTFAIAVASLASAPSLARGQARAQRVRVGILRPASTLNNTAITASLRELGYVEGRTIEYVELSARGSLDSLPGLARTMLQSKPDAVVTVGSAATRAEQDATSTIPIVFFGNFDPIAAGHVATLGRPGGNITGILIASEGTFAAKKLEFLKEAVPGAKRIAILTPDDPIVQRQVNEARLAAPKLGVELVVVGGGTGRYEAAFAQIAAAGADALLVAAHTMFAGDRMPIIELAARHRLPAIYEWAEQARDGGLMAYGPDRDKLYGRVAAYVDRILKGANPGDLPVELPTSIELAINLRTAKAMNLVVPAALLSRADEIIE
jgi:putative ABC transport system substrate-binding protein